ncbi:Uncharacterised protein [Enterobacter hormaechei]|uniref:hypothetical protein n=1 Tax=Enterobacter hormaechei TaxID=158836 RepID=UPI000E04DA01|nr:hypothetical protein [Enterobacter hormaechei]STP55961.1 Uncharacterised protein [Enterobacter hormaechei]
MFMEKDLNEGVGVYTLNSGVVIVIEGVHNDEPFIEWIELYKDENHYYKKNTGYERSYQSLVCEDDFKVLIERFCSYLWSNMCKHDFSNEDINKILSYDYTDDRLKIFFELDNTSLKISKINHPVFEKFFSGLDIKCNLAQNLIMSFIQGISNAIYFYGRCLAFEDVIDCIKYNGGVMCKIKRRGE